MSDKEKAKKNVLKVWRAKHKPKSDTIGKSDEWDKYIKRKKDQRKKMTKQMCKKKPEDGDHPHENIESNQFKRPLTNDKGKISKYRNSNNITPEELEKRQLELLSITKQIRKRLEKLAMQKGVSLDTLTNEQIKKTKDPNFIINTLH
eukprot:218835_1